MKRIRVIGVLAFTAMFIAANLAGAPEWALLHYIGLSVLIISRTP